MSASAAGTPTRFALVLLAAMAAPVAVLTSLGVLAPYLVRSFGISRGAFGWVICMATVGGGFTSPVADRLVDRIGPRRCVLVAFVMCAIAASVIAVGRGYWVLMVAGGAVALGLSHSNTATNELIVRHVQMARRGAVTGIKQAGPAVANLVGGLLIPTVAGRWGWRTTLAMLGAGAIAIATLATRMLPHDGVRLRQPASTAIAQSAGVAMGACALLTGFANSALIFLPLYCTEALGRSPSVGGLVLAIGGLAAITGRVGWTRAARSPEHAVALIAVLSAAGAIGFLLVLLADSYGGLWLLAPASLIIGATTSSWVAVAMLLAVVGSDAVQRKATTGATMLGFYVGAGLGPPIHGTLVDRTGDYSLVWMLSVFGAGTAALVMRLSVRHERAWGHRVLRSGRQRETESGPLCRMGCQRHPPSDSSATENRSA